MEGGIEDAASADEFREDGSCIGWTTQGMNNRFGGKEVLQSGQLVRRSSSRGAGV